MPYELQNKLKGPSVIRVTGVDTTGALALTAFSANQALENVTSLTVNSIKWSVLPATGTVVITRDALVVATLYATGEWVEDEFVLANTATGTLTVQVTGGGTVLVGVSKQATYNVPAMQLW
jgi:hypothetical protein